MIGNDKLTTDISNEDYEPSTRFKKMVKKQQQKYVKRLQKAKLASTRAKANRQRRKREKLNKRKGRK